MPDESTGSSLISTITRLINNSMNEGADLDNLVTVLSLLCLICVFTRQHGATSKVYTPKEAANTSPVNKLISDLMKGDSAATGGSGGPGGMDALMSLLPLLNNPQLKSKINPSTIATVLGMVNNLGGKQDAPKEKPAEKTKESSQEENQPTTEEEVPLANDPNEQENKSLGRYLNWKTNF